MFCGDWTLVKHIFPVTIGHVLRCRCWTCEFCRPDRKKRLVWEAKSGQPKVFVTLTSKRRPELTPSQAGQALVKAWRTIRREYIKEHGKGSLPFLAVFEATKRGWPHLHIVCRAKWIDQRWLSRRMGELTGSPIVDVRRVHGKSKIAAYISKYIGKNPHRFAGTKRYWRSLDWLDPVPDDGPPALEAPDFWAIVKTHLDEWAAECERAGLHLEWERNSCAISIRAPP